MNEMPKDHDPKHMASIKKAAKPSRTLFDPWNSSSTGHQRAENRLAGSTSWRESRTRKLKEQFNDRDGGGGARLADTVGAGSNDINQDGRTENGGWVRGAPGLRLEGQISLQESLEATNGVRYASAGGFDGPRIKRRKLNEKLGSEATAPESSPSKRPAPGKSVPKDLAPERSTPQDPVHADEEQIEAALTHPITRSKSSVKHLQTSEQLNEPVTEPQKVSPTAKSTPTQNQLSQHSSLAGSASTVTTDAGYSPVTIDTDRRRKPEARFESNLTNALGTPGPIFRGLNFYINGSTYPVISDHRLKQVIGQHGGSVSLGLARRSVTHVIVGELSRNGGAGGGLAASKIQKEASLGSKGEGVKYVKAEWVVESVRQMKRVSEADYQAEGIGTGGARQRSVFAMMNPKEE